VKQPRPHHRSVAAVWTRHLEHAIWIAAVLAAVPAVALEGRYLGSVNRVEGVQDGDVMRHLYDIGGRQPLPRGLDLRLRASFQYQSNLPVRNTNLLRSRLLGELRATQWRIEGQVLPWQRNTAGYHDSRERQAQFGLHWTPARAPQLDATYDRLDRDIAGLRSASESRRLSAAWNRPGYGAETSVRRIDTQPDAGLGASQRTDEWRGTAHVERAWRKVVTGGDYEGQVSKYSLRERRRRLQTQRIQGHADWTPHRKISASATVLERWGDVDDNSLRVVQPMGERGITAQVDVRPVTGLVLRALREYRRQDELGIDLVSDYLQLEARYRHDVWRGVALQTGWMNAKQFTGATAEAPRGMVYGALDGRLHPGLDARAEVRASQVQTGVSSGTHWQELTELRTRPTAATRMDVSWRRDEFPALDGRGQTDLEWQVTGAFDPSASTSISGTWRRLTGGGRITRHENHTGVSANWRPTRQLSFSANGQWRRARGTNDLGTERVLGFDVALDLARDMRLRGNMRQAQTSGIPNRRSYGVSLEKTF